jgi:hypothetical protein
MKCYEFAISKGFGTLISHGVTICAAEPEPVQGEIEFKEITQAEHEAFGPNRVPQ